MQINHNILSDTSKLNAMFGVGSQEGPSEKQCDIAQASTTLSAWLHLTDRCNLRCAYCYLPHAQADMSIDTARAAIDAIFRSALAHGYRQVKLKYAGGEALFRFPFITQLHHYAHTLANRYHLALNEVILSNGTLLTPPIIETMRSLGLRLMISLDGLEAVHDSQRYYPDGRGSFNQVKQAIELALTYQVRPDISITVSARNVQGLPELMEWVLARDLPFSLNFCHENDFSATCRGLNCEDQQLIAGMLAAYKVIEANLPRRSLLSSLVDHANLSSPHLHPCAMGHNCLVFNPHGQVFKCQMDLYTPVTTAKADDPLALVRADKTGIQNIAVDDREGCRDCEWKYWCAGGCPLATYRQTGRYDVKSPFCVIYKSLYPEAIRLEKLRLLKNMNSNT
jgi:uncharacterized protein